MAGSASTKKAPRNTMFLGAFLVGVEGPLQTTESKQKQHSSKKLTHKAPHGFDGDADLEALIDAWPTLPASTKAAITELIEDPRE